MKKETQNITALRSKTWITEALLAIMEEKEFNKIAITEIIKKADLTRQTFYRNFNTKEEVLHEYVKKLYKDCFDEIETMCEKNMFKILVTYFHYWHKNKEFLLLVKRSNVNHKVMDFYYPYMGKYFHQAIIKLNANSDLEKSYMKHFLLGGLVQIKTHWLENNFTETPEQLAELVLKLINPLIYDVKEL